mmetsp:Transcript_22855/g.36774  ORF Transcript_22855/g.36774 Transcript_22855/m.36774 type:complete len:201 (+) Transcript_22855:52-654(+)
MPKEKLAHHPQPTEYDKDKAAARVCYVQGGGGNLGSGLFVEWNGRPCIITNNHILQDEQQAGEATVLFNYRISKDTAILCHTLRGVLFLSSPFSEPMNSPMVDADHLDYTLVEVAELSTVTPLVLWPTFDARVQNHSQWSRAQVCVIDRAPLWRRAGVTAGSNTIKGWKHTLLHTLHRNTCRLLLFPSILTHEKLATARV